MSERTDKTILRVANRSRPFATFGHDLLWDTRLSPEAGMTLLRILSLPPHWRFSPKWLMSKTAIGRDRLYRILTELCTEQYCRRTRERKNDGTWEAYEYVFTDTPGQFDEPQPENQDVDTTPADPVTGLPDTAKADAYKETEVEKETEVIDTPLPPKKGAGPTPTDALRAFEAYNAVALRCALPQAAKLTKDRQRKIIARLREYGLDGWTIALANIEHSAFLRGLTDKGFRADLDFVCQAKSFSRLHDGGYGNGAHSTNRSTLSADIFAAARERLAAKEAASQ